MAPKVYSTFPPEWQMLFSLSDAPTQLDEMEESKLYELAQKHGMVPYLYRKLEDQANLKKHFSASFLNQLKQAFQQNLKRNLLMSQELIELEKLLKKSGIPILNVKGATLAQRWYGNIAYRTFGDIDLLVHYTDFLKTHRIMKKKGYQLFDQPDEHCLSTRMKLSIDASYQNPDKNVVVEVHWHLQSRQFRPRLPEKLIWQYREPVLINDNEIFTLDDSLMLNYLVYHGHKHGWVRLAWVYDLHKVVQNGNLEWVKTLQIGKNFGLLNRLGLGLHLSHVLYGTTLPVNVLEMIEKRKRLLDQQTDQIFLRWQAKLPQTPVNYIKNQFKIADRKTHGLYFLLAFLFRPTFQEWKLLRLPAGLFLLYYMIRPIRLLYSMLTRQND